MLNMSILVLKESIFGEFYCTTFLKKNLLLKYTEFLLRRTVTMLCRKEKKTAKTYSTSPYSMN